MRAVEGKPPTGAAPPGACHECERGDGQQGNRPRSDEGQPRPGVHDAPFAARAPWRCRRRRARPSAAEHQRHLDRPEPRRETLVRSRRRSRNSRTSQTHQRERHRGQRRKRQQDGPADDLDAPARRLHAVVAIPEQHGPAVLVGREHAAGCDIQLPAEQRVRHGNVSLGESEDRTHHEGIAIGHEARAARHPRQRAQSARFASPSGW